MMLVALSSVAFASDSWWTEFRTARDGEVALDDAAEADVPPPHKQTKPVPPPKQPKPAPMPEEEDVESIIASLFELLDLDSEDVDDLVQAIENVDSEDVENLVEELIGGLQGVSTGDMAIGQGVSTGDMAISDESAEKDARQMRSPTPHGDTECRTSFDCRGTGVYCYQGYGGLPNYCSRNSGSGQKDGRGSLC